MEEVINILDVCETGTKELGPGLRYVIWVQGCPFNCKGCITPEGIPVVKNNLVLIDQLVESICTQDHITGITISGGEPFMQASKLIILLKKILKRRAGLDVVIFSGFKLRELDWEEAAELLEMTDVLIDGKYVDSLNDNKGLRGSSNQQIHYLSDKLQNYRSYFEERERSVEIHVYKDYQTIIGVPNKAITLTA